MRSIVLLSICIAANGCGKPVPPAKPRPAPAASSTPAPRQRSPLDDVAAAARDAKASPPREPAVEAAPVWQVVSVHDGDTLTALDASNVQHKVRLHGIDAPEIGQAFGTVSRDALRALVLRKSVTIHGQERDRYGRVLGRLEVEGQDVNRQMVLDGLAWHFTRYSDDATLADAEVKARAAGRGLWADREPVPPWEWRASEKERRRKPVRR